MVQVTGSRGSVQAACSVFGGSHLLLPGPFPQFSAADGLRPSNPKDSSEAGVDECLNLLWCRNRVSPYFSAIEQGRLYSGAEDPVFDVAGQI